MQTKYVNGKYINTYLHTLIHTNFSTILSVNILSVLIFVGHNFYRLEVTSFNLTFVTFNQLKCSLTIKVRQF